MTITLHDAAPARSAISGLRIAAPAIAGAAAAAATGAGAGVPSLWGDEAASVMSAQRSWASLWEMAGSVDAVHALYYALLHGWIDLFGSSALSVRMPSVIATGVMVAGVFVLCRTLAGHRIAIAASVVCILLPRVGFSAAEARSAALSAAAVTWLTVLVVELARRRSRVQPGWWIVYAAGLAVSVHLFLYTALVVIVHGMLLTAVRADGRAVRAWCTASLIAVVACIPFVAVAASQRGQISWLATDDATSPEKLLVTPWFGTPELAILAWGAVASSIAWAVCSHALRRDRRPRDGRPLLVLVASLWLAIPMSALLVANAIAGPLYSGRYLAFSAPAAAILIAVGLATVRWRIPRVAAWALLVALAVPIAIHQRAEDAKFGSEWAQVSAYIGEHGRAGDGVVFDESESPAWKPRLALRLYPAGFHNIADLGLVRPYDRTPGLWDEVAPLRANPGSLDGRARVWVVSRTSDGTRDDERTLVQAGYRLAAEHRLRGDTILLYTRSAPAPAAGGAP